MDYITIIKGDDTNFLDDQFVVVSFDTEFSLSGFNATFTLGDVTLTYSDLTSKSFTIILPNKITSNLPIGKLYGELRLIDTQKRIRTITSIIPFLIKNGVSESITFINNAINVSMHINDTTINVQVETAGISKSQAISYINQMQTFNSNCESYSNLAVNSEISASNAAQKAFEYSISSANHSNLSKLWAIGSDEELQDCLSDSSIHSAKYYAEKISSGQVQANWIENNPKEKSYIQNKPDLNRLISYEYLENITIEIPSNLRTEGILYKEI